MKDPQAPQRLDAVFPVTMDAPPPITARGHRHRAFRPVMVRWWANLYPDGKVLVNVTAMGERPAYNAEVWSDFDGATTLPDWCPQAPPWFRNTAAAMGYDGPFPTHA